MFQTIDIYIEAHVPLLECLITRNKILLNTHAIADKITLYISVNFKFAYCIRQSL